MIVIKDETKRDIIEIFDTAKEFKTYINAFLKSVEKELQEEIKVNNFSEALKVYTDMTCDIIEIK